LRWRSDLGCGLAGKESNHFFTRGQRMTFTPLRGKLLTNWTAARAHFQLTILMRQLRFSSHLAYLVSCISEVEELTILWFPVMIGCAYSFFLLFIFCENQNRTIRIMLRTCEELDRGQKVRVVVVILITISANPLIVWLWAAGTYISISIYI